jgi:hypothetical protein
LHNFLCEGQTQVGLLVVGVEGDAQFGVGDGESVVF